jgi:hypothetical protein
MPTWDGRIDEAARRLTEGEPRAGFRTRVVARLDDRPRRWSTVWVLAPAAAAAIVVLTIVMPREEIGDVALKPERAVAEKTVVGLKADTTQKPTDAGLKADTTPDPVDPKADTTEVRLKPDTTPDQAGLKAGTTAAGPVADVAMPVELDTDLTVAPIELAPVTVPATIVEALVEPAPLAVESLTIAALDSLDSGQ